MAKEYISLMSDRIRLYVDGSVSHWDGAISVYRPGWGPYRHQPLIGDFGRAVEEWRRSNTRG